MAAGSTVAAKKRGPGRPFQPGQSGNPLGASSTMRERRKMFAERLDAACKAGDADLFVEAVMQGVAALDPTCMKLCASYRFGPPEQQIELTGSEGGPLRISAKQLSDDELAAIAAQGLKK